MPLLCRGGAVFADSLIRDLVDFVVLLMTGVDVPLTFKLPFVSVLDVVEPCNDRSPEGPVIPTLIKK